MQVELKDIQFLAARKIAYCVLISQGWKGRESDILPIDADDYEREELIKQFGYVTVTKPDGTRE